MPDESDLRKMPADIAEVYDGLFQETGRAHVVWKYYQQLYAVDSAQIDLLNRTAPAFFYFLQDVLMDDIILAISRITGPSQTGRGSGAKDNLSLEQLLAKIRVTEAADFCSELYGLLAQIRVHCAGLDDLRNRTIAHIDLRTALKTHPDPLPDISRKLIGEALETCAAFLNRVTVHFTSIPVYYDFPMHGDAGDLIFFLRQAEEYEAKNEAAMRQALGGA